MIVENRALLDKDVIQSLKTSLSVMWVTEIGAGKIDDMYCRGELIDLVNAADRCKILSRDERYESVNQLVYKDDDNILAGLTVEEREAYDKLNTLKLAPCMFKAYQDILVDEEPRRVTGMLYKMSISDDESDGYETADVSVNIVYEKKHQTNISISELGMSLLLEGSTSERKFIRACNSGIIKPIILRDGVHTVAIDCGGAYKATEDGWRRIKIAEMKLGDSMTEQLLDLNRIIGRYRRYMGVLGLCEYHIIGEDQR